MAETTEILRARNTQRLVSLLPKGRSLVLVGLMGAGKSSIGRRLAERLDMEFRDADSEIETAAGCSVSEFFANYGEAAFRDGERRVIGRLLEEGQIVLATGGGAFMQNETRACIRERAISIWMKADLDVLVRRTSRRNTRPLLLTGDPRNILQDLMAKRHPDYAKADITVESHDAPHEIAVDAVVAGIEKYLKENPSHDAD